MNNHAGRIGGQKRKRFDEGTEGAAASQKTIAFFTGFVSEIFYAALSYLAVALSLDFFDFKAIFFEHFFYGSFAKMSQVARQIDRVPAIAQPAAQPGLVVW